MMDKKVFRVTHKRDRTLEVTMKGNKFSDKEPIAVIGFLGCCVRDFNRTDMTEGMTSRVSTLHTAETRP